MPVGMPFVNGAYRNVARCLCASAVSVDHSRCLETDAGGHRVHAEEERRAEVGRR